MGRGEGTGNESLEERTNLEGKSKLELFNGWLSLAAGALYLRLGDIHESNTCYTLAGVLALNGIYNLTKRR